MITKLTADMLMSNQVRTLMQTRALTHYGFVTTLLVFAMIMNIVRADSANSSEAKPANSLETQVTSVVQEFHQALENGNRDSVHQLLAHDVVVYEQGEVDASREQYESQHLSNDIAFFRDLDYVVLKQDVYSNEATAWVLSTIRIAEFQNNQLIDSFGTETMVLRHAPEGWVIAHIHWSFQGVEHEEPVSLALRNDYQANKR